MHDVPDPPVLEFTVSEVRNTPELVNSKLSVVTELVHCSLEPEPETVRLVWLAAGRLWVPLLVSRVVVPEPWYW